MERVRDCVQKALNRYGNLDKLALHDALDRAYENVLDISNTCYIQLLQRSADLLLPPQVNSWVRFYRKFGVNGVKKQIDLAVPHYRSVSWQGDSSLL